MNLLHYLQLRQLQSQLSQLRVNCWYYSRETVFLKFFQVGGGGRGGEWGAVAANVLFIFLHYHYGSVRLIREILQRKQHICFPWKQ